MMLHGTHRHGTLRVQMAGGGVGTPSLGTMWCTGVPCNWPCSMAGDGVGFADGGGPPRAPLPWARSIAAGFVGAVGMGASTGGLAGPPLASLLPPTTTSSIAAGFVGFVAAEMGTGGLDFFFVFVFFFFFFFRLRPNRAYGRR